MDNYFLLNIYRKIRYNFLQRHVYGITATIRTLPDFIVIGAKRCGTTSIYQYLENHPCIKKSSHDHIGFFDDNFSLGELFYRSFFPTLRILVYGSQPQHHRPGAVGAGRGRDDEQFPSSFLQQRACRNVTAADDSTH